MTDTLRDVILTPGSESFSTLFSSDELQLLNLADGKRKNDSDGGDVGSIFC